MSVLPHGHVRVLDSYDVKHWGKKEVLYYILRYGKYVCESTIRQYCICHWWQYNHEVVLSHLPQYKMNASSVGSMCIINDMASMCA